MLNKTAVKEMIFSGLGPLVRNLDDVLRPKPACEDYSTMKRLLFLAYSPALGTAVNETPIFEALKTVLPNCRIALAAAGLAYQVMEHNPYIDYVWKTGNAEENPVAAGRDIRRAIADTGFRPDCICIDSSNRRSKPIVAAYLAGAMRRVGFALYPGLLHKSLRYDPSLSIIQNNLRLASLFGGENIDAQPRVFYTARHIASARRLLDPLAKDGTPIAAFITQGSGSAPTAWYASRFVELADFVHRSLGANIVFLGGSEHVQPVEKLREELPFPSLSLAGKTDISTLAAVLAQCDLGVTIDTGAMHVARAIRLPLVILAHARDASHVWLPLGQDHFKILRHNEIDCRNCGKSTCSHRACMDFITADDAKRAVIALLKEFPPSRMAKEERMKSSLKEALIDQPHTLDLAFS